MTTVPCTLPFGQVFEAANDISSPFAMAPQRAVKLLTVLKAKSEEVTKV
jgi:hypothetical protein